MTAADSYLTVVSPQGRALKESSNLFGRAYFCVGLPIQFSKISGHGLRAALVTKSKIHREVVVESAKKGLVRSISAQIVAGSYSRPLGKVPENRAIFWSGGLRC